MKYKQNFKFSGPRATGIPSHFLSSATSLGVAIGERSRRRDTRKCHPYISEFLIFSFYTFFFICTFQKKNAERKLSFDGFSRSSRSDIFRLCGFFPDDPFEEHTIVGGGGFVSVRQVSTRREREFRL